MAFQAIPAFGPNNHLLHQQNGENLHVPHYQAVAVNDPEVALLQGHPEDDIWTELQKSRCRFSCGTDVATFRIRELESQDLHALLLQAHNQTPESIEKLLKTVSLEGLKAVLQQFHNVSDAHLDVFIKILAESYALFQRPLASDSPPPVGKRGIFDILKLVFENDPHSPFEAMPQIQAFYLTLMIPFFFLGFATVLGAETSTDPLVVFAICASIFWSIPLAIKVSSYFPSVPTNLKPMDNYTVISRTLEPLSGRDEVISRVFSSWQSNNLESRQHPLLVGPAGAGKTAIMQEIARRISLEGVPQDLKGKTMFGGPAAALLPSNPLFDTNDKLERLLNNVMPHTNKVIIGIDEIQAILTDQYTRYKELLKSALDTGPRGLTYFMAATTDEEYFKYIASDTALSRRFLVVHVPVLAEQEVKVSLREMIQRQYPHVPVSDDFLEQVYAFAEKLSLYLKEKHPQLRIPTQPQFSKTLLTRIISRIVLKQTEPPISKDFYQHQGRLKYLKSQTFSSQDIQTALALKDQISQEEKEVTGLKERMDSELTDINDLKSINTKLEKCQKEIRDLAVKIESIRQRTNMNFLKRAALFCYSHLRGESEEFLLKKLILYRFYLMPQWCAKKQPLEQQFSSLLVVDRIKETVTDYYKEFMKINKVEAAPPLPFLEEAVPL